MKKKINDQKKTKKDNLNTINSHPEQLSQNDDQDDNNLDQQQQNSSPSNYPSSLQQSNIKINKIKQSKPITSQNSQISSNVQPLSKNHHQIVTQYLKKIQNYKTKQLLVQRQELLEQLQSINIHLSQMIANLYGDMEQENHSINEVDQSQINNESIRKNSNNDSQIKRVKAFPASSSNLMSLNNSNLIHSKDKANQMEQLTQNQLDKLQQKNLKHIAALNQQLNDYEFMLTGQYVQKLEQQVINSQKIRRELHYEVMQLDKQAKKYTRAYDKDALQKIQKSIYDLQIQITQLNQKYQTKNTKLKTITSQIKQKQKKIQKLAYQEQDIQKLLSMYEDEEFQNKNQSKQKQQNYQKLKVRKEKLEKIINSYNNNHLKLYNKKLVDFRNLDVKIEELEEEITKMEYNVVVISKQRKEIQAQSKNILGERKKIQSLIDVRKSSLPVRSGYKSNTDAYKQTQNISQFIKNRNNKNNKTKIPQLLQKQKFKTNKSQSNPPLPNRQTSQSKKIVDKGYRKRVYTQLQNSHYFSSLQRNKPNKMRLHTQNNEAQTEFLYDDEQSQSLQKQNNQKSLIHIPTKDIVQKQNDFHKNYNDNSKQVKNSHRKLISQNKKQNENNNAGKIIRNQSRQKNQSKKQSIRKQHAQYSTNSNIILKKQQQRRQTDVQKRLIKLENMLKKQNTITLNPMQYNLQNSSSPSPIITQKLNYLNSISKSKPIYQSLQKSKQSLSSSNNKIKKGPLSSASDSGTSQFSYENKIRSRTKMTQNDKKSKLYYKELCERLGKDKLLIQEDEDVADLIYHGIEEDIKRK